MAKCISSEKTQKVLGSHLLLTLPMQRQEVKAKAELETA